MFSWLDLIAPIGINLIALVFGIWGAIVSDAVGGKVSCIATAVAFTVVSAVIYILRWRFWRYDYKTKYGVRVTLGKTNKPTKSIVEGWSEWTVSFWIGQKWPEAEVWAALKGARVRFIDAESYYVSGFAKLVYGAYDGSFMSVGTKNPESVFKHELSHRILDKLGIPWDKHHDIFALRGLGH